jgi:hypothetical protein
VRPIVGYLRHGLALKAMGRFNEALVSLRKGRQVDPKFTKLVDIIAEVTNPRRYPDDQGQHANHACSIE